MIAALSNQTDLTSNLFWIMYILALVISVAGVLVFSKLRHDRAVERFRRNVAIARKDASSVWPSREYEEE